MSALVAIRHNACSSSSRSSGVLAQRFISSKMMIALMMIMLVTLSEFSHAADGPEEDSDESDNSDQSSGFDGIAPGECTTDQQCADLWNLHPAGPCETYRCSAQGTCVKNMRNSSFVCRASAGACDQEEFCNGADAACPEDRFHRNNVCRAAAGPCDDVEYCTGFAAACPEDKLHQSDYMCRGLAGQCDVIEYCSGLDAACPADFYASNTTVCRESVGDCDIAEKCSGVTAACPSDSFRPRNSVCRASRGVCDPAEVCSGINAHCPNDHINGAETVCRVSAGTCDAAETCDGESFSCPSDAKHSAGTVCRPASDKCDIADTCDGSSNLCDNKRKDHAFTTVDADGKTTVCNQSAACSTTCFDAAISAENVAMYQCQKLTGALTAIATNLTAASDNVSQCPVWPPECRVDADCHSMVEVDQCQQVHCSAAGKCEAMLRPRGTVCRPAVGTCDQAETCDGVAAACPADTFKRGHVCRPAAGPCDLEEACSGDVAECPADTMKDSATLCRGSAGDCDAAEFCTGNSSACPADKMAPSTKVCRPANGACDLAEYCSGQDASCSFDNFKPFATVCRASRGVCDPTESCSGHSPACPNDAVSSAATVCRPSAGGCDVAETCDGQGDHCPTDAFQPQGFSCRASSLSDMCDLPDFCDGSSAQCVDNRNNGAYQITIARNSTNTTTESCGFDREASTYQCTDRCFRRDTMVSFAAYQCQKLTGDLVEIADLEWTNSTTTEGVKCPVWPPECVEDEDCLSHIAVGTCEKPVCAQGKCRKSFLSSTTLCRAATGSCDAAEFCTGSSAACPADEFHPSSFICRAQNGACDVHELCTGNSAECPMDAFAGRDVTCRHPAGPCDSAEVCSGSSGECPADEFAPTTVLCRDVVGSCDIPEYCTGSGVLCPADAFIPANTVCRQSAGMCDLAETCSGNSGVCPDDALAPSTQVCRVSTGACDAVEYCTGSSSGCPVDSLHPAGFECSAAADKCDLADTCDGVSKTCVNHRKDYAFTFTDATGAARSCGVAGGDAEALDYPACVSHYKQTCFTAEDSAFQMYQCQQVSGDLAKTETKLDAETHCFEYPVQCSTDADCLNFVKPEACQRAVCSQATGQCALELRPTSHTCRAATSDCDVAETCDGVNAECPTDSFAAASILCRADAGPCDVAEFCTGLSATCPDDAMKASSSMCRGSAGACDAVEYCSGTDSACPADVFAPATTMCRPATVGFTCDEPDFCTGSSYACPNDRFRVEGATCETLTGRVSSCDGLSKRCSSSRANLATNQIGELTPVPAAPPVNGENGAALEQRALSYSCDGTCYVCGANVTRDVVFAIDGTAGLRKSAQECSMGLCQNLVVLPFPRCLETCVSRTCPNNQPVEKTAFYRHNVEEFKCVEHSTTAGQETCPPWDHIPATERLPDEGVAGGDPRYSVNGEIIQCDVLGEQLYAKNGDYSIFVNHAPIGSHGATYIDTIRVAFSAAVAAEGLPTEIVLTTAGWKTDVLKTSDGAKAVSVHETGIHSSDIPISLTVEVTAGGALKMMNFGYTGLAITEGIMVNGCPKTGTADVETPAAIPEHPACADISSADLKKGCNFDMWATDGDMDVATANVAMSNLVSLVEYQQPEMVPITEEMKKEQADIPASGNAGNSDAGVKPFYDQANGEDKNQINMTAVVASIAGALVIAAILGSVFLLRHRRIRGDDEVDAFAHSQSLKYNRPDAKKIDTIGATEDPSSPLTVNAANEMSVRAEDDAAIVKFMETSGSTGRNPLHQQQQAQSLRKRRNFNEESMSMSQSQQQRGFLRPNSGGQTTTTEESINRMENINA